MEAFPHIPPATIKETPVVDYLAYPRLASDEISAMLQRVRVHSVSAVSYQCTPHWQLHRRTIDDRLFFILSGRSWFEIEGRTATVGPGDCVHLRRRVLHKAYTDSQQPMRMISLRYTATIFETLTLPELIQLPDFMHPGLDSPVRSLLEEACREYALRPAGWECGLNAQVLRLLLHLIREETTENSLLVPTKKVMELQRLQPALKAIRTHLARPLPMQALAQLCGLSEVQFRRVFQSALGLSPVQYVRRIRMEEACRLLQHTSETVESIAARVGYREPAFFSNSFKKIVGVSPGQYRSTSSL